MSEAPIKATLKAGGGYEAPWVTVDANTPEELNDRLDGLANLGSLGKVVEVAELLRAAHVVASPSPAPAAGATVTQSAPPVSSGPVCPHGARTRREGNGAKGKWVGYFCPLQKGDPNQCKPVWED